METERDAIALPNIRAEPPGEVPEERNPQQTVDAQHPIDGATLLKLMCSGYSFFCAGVNDGSLGPLIPYLLRSYGISTNFVSIMYGLRSNITSECRQ